MLVWVRLVKECFFYSSTAPIEHSSPVSINRIHVIFKTFHQNSLSAHPSKIDENALNFNKFDQLYLRNMYIHRWPYLLNFWSNILEQYVYEQWENEYFDYFIALGLCVSFTPYGPIVIWPPELRVAYLPPARSKRMKSSSPERPNNK